MFKHLFRITLGAFVWKRYKRLILSTLLLFVYFWLVAKIHSDFIAFSQLNNYQENLGWSFIIKWLAFGFGLLVFWLFNTWRRKVQDAEASPVEQELLTKSVSATRKPGNLSEPDPFADIRQRKALRSRAELIIEKKQPENKQ